eukprot:TRINITY_DN63854_c0_g1_i1.p1 TRINITY_DN63854_c0_g1~~TRINITY_DN63854_c0_g1_i1.p1  ORF type:complete len:125 (-),score=19.62 TRINITY_DN63854_c0_g1_i1:73-405(-)
MPGSTAYEEGVWKEHYWSGKWAKETVAARKAGTLKAPSPWRLGKLGRPTYPALKPLAGSNALVRSSTEPFLANPMVTTHMQTEMKRSFCLDTSVLGAKYTPAHKITRRMD